MARKKPEQEAAPPPPEEEPADQASTREVSEGLEEARPAPPEGPKDIGAEAQAEIDAQVAEAPEARPPDVTPDPQTGVGSLWDKPGVAQHVEDVWARPSEQALRQAVADWVGADKDWPTGKGKGTLLDVGCGSARIAPMLEGWEYYGIDGSVELLRMAAGRVQPSRLVAHDLSFPLPFRDDEFDVVLCMQVLRHLPSYEDLVAEMTRVARRYVYIVDMFSEAGSHHYANVAVVGQEFGNNAWSLPLFQADAGRLTGWQMERHPLTGLAWGVTGIRMEAP